MGGIVTKLIQNYTDGHEDSLQEAWDYVQAQVRGHGRLASVRLCVCGWSSVGLGVPDRQKMLAV